MIKLTCGICGYPANRIKWVVTSTTLPKDGLFKKEDIVGTASYVLFGNCPNCGTESPVKGDWSWRLAGGRGWKDLVADETYPYEFGEK